MTGCALTGLILASLLSLSGTMDKDEIPDNILHELNNQREAAGSPPLATRHKQVVKEQARVIQQSDLESNHLRLSVNDSLPTFQRNITCTLDQCFDSPQTTFEAITDTLVGRIMLDSQWQRVSVANHSSNCPQGQSYWLFQLSGATPLSDRQNPTLYPGNGIKNFYPLRNHCEKPPEDAKYMLCGTPFTASFSGLLPDDDQVEIRLYDTTREEAEELMGMQVTDKRNKSRSIIVFAYYPSRLWRWGHRYRAEVRYSQQGIPEERSVEFQVAKQSATVIYIEENRSQDFYVSDKFFVMFSPLVFRPGSNLEILDKHCSGFRESRVALFYRLKPSCSFTLTINPTDGSAATHFNFHLIGSEDPASFRASAKTKPRG